MADPVVSLTNGVPTSGTGAITTLGQTLLDGANITHGATTDAAVTAGATGSLSAKLRSISRDIVANIVLAAGSATIGTVNVAPSQLGTLGNTTMSGSVPVTAASDQTVTVKGTTTSNGLTASRVNAAASTNATNLKASAGNIFEIDVYNVAAYDVFLKLYNKASAPTVGTDTPVWTIPIKAGTGFSRVFPMGRQFGTGISYAITKLQADSDTTATVASDVTGTIAWI